MTENPPQDDIIDIEPKVIGETAAHAQSTRPRAWWVRGLPFVTLAIMAAVGGGWLYRDLISNYLPSDQVTGLAQRVSTIETSVKETQKRVDAVVALTEEFKAKLSAAQASADKAAKLNADTSTVALGSANDLAALKAEFEKLAAATADLQARPAGSSAPAAVDPALVARLAQLEKQIAAPLTAPGEVQDFTPQLKTLKSQVQAGQAFAVALAPLARALPAAPGLDVLGAERAGLANHAALAAELDGLRASLPKPVATADESGVWASIKGALSKLVRVRGQGQEDWAITAAKASAFAIAGDLEQASGLFTKLDSATPPSLKAWAEKAQRRVKLDKALDSFSAALIRAGLTKE